MAHTLTGALNFASVPAALAQTRALVQKGGGPVEIDLSGVTRVDSAGVALLLELTRQARAGQRELRLRGAPQQLRRLADFFGVAPLLELS